jgi:ubiquinone/menaquinone biosynthesis C-methylase UbiE
MSESSSERRLRLVVGGGLCPDFPKLKPSDISLNVAERAKPHVQGDIGRAPFEDAIFAEVFFEFVNYSSFTGQNVKAIKECARVLQAGGRLIIHTGRGVNVAEVTAEMRQNGFRFIRVTNKGYIRITGKLAGS